MVTQVLVAKRIIYLQAEGEKGMLAKGPELHMKTSPAKLNDSGDQEAFVARVRA